jgi:uncharacterized protein (TIGR03067 family)
MKTACVLLAALALVVSVPLAAQEKGGDAKLDPAKLVGKWQYVSGVKNGEKIAEDNLKEPVIITKDKITLKGKELFVFKYEIDAAKKPAAIELEMLESPFGAGAKAAGIIELKGDELRLCYAAMGGAAPKTFESKEGSQAHLFVLKRAK